MPSMVRPSDSWSPRQRGRGASARLLLLLFALGGCGTSPTAPAPIPSPTPITTYQGNWFGTTFQGRPISFAVVENEVTSIAISYSLVLTPNDLFPPGFCPPTTAGSVAEKLQPPIQIAGGGFTWTQCGPTQHCGGNVGMATTFGSTNTASGTIDVSVGGYIPLVGAVCPYGAQATWQATRRQ
jgi:hypothetical protein